MPPRTLLGAILVFWSCALSVRAHPPSAIAVDADGKVYFAHGNDGVFRIDEGGKLTPVSRLAMHWMAIDLAGKFADAPDEFGEWFGRLTRKGQRPTLISCSEFPCAVGKDGNLYFARMHSLTIMRRAPDGKESELASREKFGIEEKRPVGVNGLACGPDGRVYIVSLENERGNPPELGEHVVYAIGMDGAIRTVAKNFITEKLPEDQRHPEVRPEYCRGLAVDEKGNVFVAATGNRCVMKLSAETGEPSVVWKTQKPWTPTGVDVFKGEVYVLEFDDETPTDGRSWPARVRKVKRDGTDIVLAREAWGGDFATAPHSGHLSGVARRS
jgi:hypothetical protein